MTHDEPRRHTTTGGRSRLLLWLLLVATGLQISIVWCATLPLGVPGEWTWPRIHFSSESASGWGLATALAAIYLAFVWAGGRRLRHCRRGEPAAWLCGLVVAGFFWLTGVQAAVPGVAGLPKAHFVLYYPRSSGYFWQARYDAETTAQFLAGYERRMAEGDYLHIGTHPPGLTLCFRGLSALCRAVPELTEFLLWSQPDSVRESADEIRARAATTTYPYTPADVACVWLATVLVQCAAAATVVPVYLLLRDGADRTDAWHAAALWPLAPALAIFLPKSDAMFPLLSMLIAWLWCSGWRRQSIWRCGFAGLVLFAGLFLSLAFLPVLVLLVVWTVIEALSRAHPGSSGASRWRWSACITAVVSAVVLPLIVVRFAWDVDLLRIWRWNLVNHARFYAHFHRTYWAWLFVNPLELCFAAGAPLAALGAIGLLRGSRAPARDPSMLSFLIVWSLLWISGKNMGEAARLWLILIPWLVLAAPTTLANVYESNGTRRQTVWVAVAALQAAVSIATVTGVDGFHFDEMLPATATAVGNSYRAAP